MTTTAVLFWTSVIRIITSVSSSTTETPSPQSGSSSSSNSTSGWNNSTTEEPTPHPTAPPPPTSPPIHHNGLAPIIGLPGPYFTAIHGSALTALSLSILSVSGLFIYLGCISGSVKEPGKGPPSTGTKPRRPEGEDHSSGAKAPAPSQQQKAASRIPFRKWNIGERFVVYLGVCDLAEGTSHWLDHAYMLFTEDSPPDTLCTIFAFFLHYFVICQWMVVVASSVSASSLIVFGRKMSLGRRDWRLIAFSFGIPLIIAVTAGSLGLLGASGAWCFVKYGANNWLVYTQFVSIFQISLYGTVGLSYGAIWVKIQRTTKLMKGSTTERYQNSARVMMIFVAVFILQWCTYTLFSIWSLLSVPPAIVLVLAVIFINLGGVYNCVAYTLIRRKLQSQKRSNAVTSNHNDTDTSTANSSGAPKLRPVSAPRGPVPAAAQGGSPGVLISKEVSKRDAEDGEKKMEVDGVGSDEIQNNI